MQVRRPLKRPFKRQSALQKTVHEQRVCMPRTNKRIHGCHIHAIQAQFTLDRSTGYELYLCSAVELTWTQVTRDPRIYGSRVRCAAYQDISVSDALDSNVSKHDRSIRTGRLETIRRNV